MNPTEPNDVPRLIYLQWYGDGDPEAEVGPVSENDVTWCRERIFKHDIEFIPATELERVRREVWAAAIEVAAEFGRSIRREDIITKLQRTRDFDLEQARDTSGGKG